MKMEQLYLPTRSRTASCALNFRPLFGYFRECPRVGPVSLSRSLLVNFCRTSVVDPHSDVRALRAAVLWTGYRAEAMGAEPLSTRRSERQETSDCGGSPETGGVAP